MLESWHAPVFRFLVRLCAGDRAAAEDLTQDAFLRAFRAFERLPADANYRAWLFRIAYNVFLNDRRRARPDTNVVPETAARVVSHEQRELLRAIAGFVATLPGKQRAALILRAVEGRDYAEVAEILGCTEESARANAYQALRKVRQRFGEEYASL